MFPRQIPRVQIFNRRDAWIVSNYINHLLMAHINGGHMKSATFQQNLRKATRGCADVQCMAT